MAARTPSQSSSSPRLPKLTDNDVFRLLVNGRFVISGTNKGFFRCRGPIMGSWRDHLRRRRARKSGWLPATCRDARSRIYASHRWSETAPLVLNIGQDRIDGASQRRRNACGDGPPSAFPNGKVDLRIFDALPPPRRIKPSESLLFLLPTHQYAYSRNTGSTVPRQRRL